MHATAKYSAGLIGMVLPTAIPHKAGAKHTATEQASIVRTSRDLRLYSGRFMVLENYRRLLRPI